MRYVAGIALILVLLAGCDGAKKDDTNTGAADTTATQPDPLVSPDST